MKHQELNAHVRYLITMEETESPIVSCYVNLELGERGYRGVLQARAQVLRKALRGNDRRAFEYAFSRVQEFLGSSVKATTRGVALFSRGGASPFFLPMQFQVSLPTEMSVDSTPNIYRLVELKDTYHRYILVIACKKEARILEVSLGAITRQLWTERPELRKRVGREWTKQHYQSHRWDRTRQFIKETIAVIERVMSAGGHTHLVLAGIPRTTAEVRKGLPPHLSAKLVDVIPASSKDKVLDVVEATLSSFIDQEEQESLAMVDRLEREIRRGGLAGVGTDECLRGLREGRVDVLVMASSYIPPPGWSCGDCGAVGSQSENPATCPECGATVNHDVDLKETMVRLAKRSGSHIEIVRDSEILMGFGGVGCLLRYTADPPVKEFPYEATWNIH